MQLQRNILRPLVGAALVLIVIGAFSRPCHASSAIGVAVTNGSFQVDHSRVWGNTTLFDGSLIETAAATSQLQLTGGVQMRLASNSRATVYRKRLVLESGFGQLESALGFEVDAGSLRILPVARDAVAKIRLSGDRRVTVAALRGSVKVANGAGLLIANVEAGNSLDFEPQAAGASAPTKVSGCLLSKAGKWIVADHITNLVLEVRGAGLDAEVGNRVEIVGQAESTSPSVPGATQLIHVTGLREIDKGGCASLAKKLGATTAVAAAGAASGTAAAGSAGAAGTATAGGIGIGTVAVIGGVATAATVGGLAAVGNLPGEGSNQPSASR